MQKYIGSYHNALLKDTMSVWINEGKITARFGKQSSFILTPVKENVFNNLQCRVVMEFFPEKNEFALIQHGLYLVFVK